MNSLFRLKRSQKGFTILEVMIAMAIFAIGILGVAKMQIKSQTGNTSARTITQGTTYTQDRIERLMSVPYTDPIMAAGPGNATVAGASSGETYTLNWTITDNNPIVNTKQIAITATWNDQGLTRNFSTNYYRARNF